MEQWLGKTITKEFGDLGKIRGAVKSYDSSRGLFEIVYEDGDSEELDSIEVSALLGFSPSADRKPTKRRRIEDGGENLNLNCNDHCNNPRLSFDLNDAVCMNDDDCLNGGGVGRVDLDLNLNECLDLNAVVEVGNEFSLCRAEDFSRSNVIDLNADVNEAVNCLFEKGDSYVVKENENGHSFDLNLAAVEEPANFDAKCSDMKGKEKIDTQAGNEAKNEKRKIVLGLCCLSVQRPPAKSRGGLTKKELVDGSSKGVAINLVGKGRRGRKKRDLSDTPDGVSEPVTKRRSRLGKTGLSYPDNVPETVVPDAVNDPFSSPAQSAVSDEKVTVSSQEYSEEENVLPPKPELPPSSDKLGLDGIPVLDIFSIYAFLRSFSSLLFLSPFELEDFVASIKCNTPTALFDCIHVSLLQMLRKHLESLSSESSESASNCLRSLNWNLLDTVTWPIFLVEYLLMHSSGVKLDFDICRLKLIESDYYGQPASLKIEILRHLCDDVNEVEAIRSELSGRTATSKQNIDFDQTMKLDSLKKRRVPVDLATGSCLTEEMDDDTNDWNSDECCLCKMDGNLICCDGCPAAFHSKCVGIVSSLLPDGDWYCPECIINKKMPWMKVGKSIRGAELLGIDPYGQLFYSCCGYLLVSDPWGDESSIKYYDRNDLPAVIRALKSSEDVYRTLLVAISKLCDASSLIDGTTSNLCLQNKVICEDFPMMPLPENNDKVNGGEPVDMVIISLCSGDQGCEKSETMDLSAKMEKKSGTSEESTDLSQAHLSNQNSNGSGMQDDSEITHNLLNSENCYPGKRSDNEPVSLDQASLTTCLVPQQQYVDAYVNFYSFARSASSIYEELTHKTSDKSTEDVLRSEEKIISSQLKAISNKSANFCWPNIQNLSVDSREEKCGWCFFCRGSGSERDCLFLMNDSGPAPESFSSEALGACKRKPRKDHLVDVLCHIISIEDRLHGLLLGPWLTPTYSQILRESVIAASDVASLRILLLELESNLRRLALSAEWVKQVDSLATIGSACHILNKSGRVSYRNGTGKKVSRSDLKSNPSSNDGSGLQLLWWRGGRLSRQLFSWKVLPRSLARRAARQGGGKKIPGVLYSEGVELAKRSKFVAWRASVETSRSVEQLALQVRDLDANIRWNDIGNANILSMMDKHSKKPGRSFKNVSIEQKSSQGQVVKYLLDFGKRRFIPDIVLKHGSIVEEPSDKNKRYWLEETHVPLHLLKAFEEKRIACESSKIGPIKLSEREQIIKKPIKKKGLSYLFSRAEKAENYQCGHCNKDVLKREAVSCQTCKGFFHKRHLRKSAGAILAQCVYTCHKCQNEKPVKRKAKEKLEVKINKNKNNNTSKILKALRTKKRGAKGRKPEHCQNNTDKVPVVIPLRRSARRAKIVSMHAKNTKKKIGTARAKILRSRRETSEEPTEVVLRKKRSRRETSKKPTEVVLRKKRTQLFRTYWLNGLWLSHKPNDERVALFRSKKLIVLSGQSGPSVDSPKCSLCGELKPTLAQNYIACEACGDWFHGDAFGLTHERLDILIGFKCHKCLDKTPPVCPRMPMIWCTEEAKHVGPKIDAKIDKQLLGNDKSLVESNDAMPMEIDGGS